MNNRISRFIDENRLINRGDKLVVGLSGGADSVCLLHVLISLREKYDLSISAAHFNHGIRGAEADRDENFVRELCEKWETPLFVERADVPAVAEKLKVSVETCGRHMRYEFFDRIIQDQGGGKIATAHHMDDNSETVLWNLTRGSGLLGLAGIRPMRDNIIRPLLCLTRAEIEDYCRENELSFVTDSTNLSDDYTRNRLRHRVMPELRKLNPNVSQSVSHTSVIMREADEYLNKISLSELKSAETEHGYSCGMLMRADPIVLKYAVKNVLNEAGAPVDFEHIALVIDAMSTSGAVNLGEGFTASCAQGNLRVYKEKDLSPNGEDHSVPFSEYIKTKGKRIEVRNGHLEFTDSADTDGLKINNLFLKHCIPCDIITENTVFRYRRAGDTFTDARRGVTKSLKKLMNELKLPREERDSIAVVADGSTILWLEGYGTSAHAKVDLTRDGDIIFIGG